MSLVTPLTDGAPVIKAASWPVDNRPGAARSLQALRILQALEDLPVGHTGLKTGELVDRIGRARNKAGFASVSRTLMRLVKSSNVEAFQSAYSQRGGGLFYRIPGRGHVPS